MAEAIAVNLREMMLLDTPVIVIVSGEGGSGGALGIAVGDRVLIQEYAIYSVIPPEGCASILWCDQAKKVEAAAALKLTVPASLRRHGSRQMERSILSKSFPAFTESSLSSIRKTIWSTAMRKLCGPTNRKGSLSD